MYIYMVSLKNSIGFLKEPENTEKNETTCGQNCWTRSKLRSVKLFFSGQN